MKRISILLLFLVFLTFELYSQQYIIHIVDSICQSNSTISRTDSTIILKSDNLSLYKRIDCYDSVLYTDRKLKRHISKELTRDSLLILLFNKRYLTPDILRKAYLSKRIKITEEGDTVNLTKTGDTTEYYFYSISVNEFEKRKDRKHISIEIGVTRPMKDHCDENGYPIFQTPFSSFVLVIESTINANKEQLVEFINKSSFRYLYFESDYIAI